ncbi:5'-methylthioadenosine/S-adenosylhomocysteine nucleosidase [Natronohydrobacter thiooxidans]|uniref:5'-methylthioadenosine/S-adenosylhomocysteine nucleosidase n=1 Tax=Natronohydrobacter thiooxidans TaxID=87172 RepID=UPI0008FF31F9|nr:5'-methylthioadenosine/S-adenosylhomocysteine nucleosidase [Natronohydrobacter thiooxidans]
MLTGFAGRRVLFLMAAEAEYGPCLRAQFTPVMTGVGPVEAAVVATATLADLDRQGARPDLVVSLGSAGSARLEHCGVYQATALAYRDMDASPLGFAKGVTPFLDLPARVDLGDQIPGLPGASLSTGANIVSGPDYARIAEDMVDMESFAIWRACQRFDLPLIVLRGISDGTAPLEGLHSWTEYLHIIDEKLAQAVGQLRDALQAGEVRG